MEFTATVNETEYNFYFINPSSVLVSGKDAEYILYKIKYWNCADEISKPLLESFAQTIEEHLQSSKRTAL